MLVHGADKQAAVKWLDELQTTGQYAKDVWTAI